MIPAKIAAIAFRAVMRAIRFREVALLAASEGVDLRWKEFEFAGGADEAHSAQFGKY
jgi:hypothetical protein